ncbi:MAG: hypothetical protein JO068_10795, partial [Hyphomicrobiales bacterium]|nr:hypothetical protein [Hyphomicrobiales bacterium]
AAAIREDRAVIADQQIGRILAHAPLDPDDGAWPHSALRDLIEQEWSDDLTHGFVLEQLVKRGPVQRAIYEGGDQEANLATQARGWANTAGARWHRTAEVLAKIADMWDAESSRLDTDAKKRRIADE